MKLSVSVISAIASSTSASSFIGEYATTTRYTQRSIEKSCEPQEPVSGQSNTCSTGSFSHEESCDITCDATNVTIEQTCSCYTSFGPIMMPRAECVWEGQTHSNCGGSRGIDDFVEQPPEKVAAVAITTPAPPSKPEKPVTTDKPHMPEKPEISSKPDKPEKPETPEKPDQPTKPHKPETPDQPEKPDEPETPTFSCPDLSSFGFGSWKCKGKTSDGQVTDGGICAATCNKGFKFGLGNSKFGIYHCKCHDEDCRWKQQSSLVEKAKNEKPDLVTAISSISWDSSIIFGESIIPTCEPIENVDNNKVCSDVPDIADGFFRCSKGNGNGSSCFLMCNTGFVATGYQGSRARSKCNVKKGGWSEALENFSCVSNIDAIENGMDIVSTSFCSAAHDKTDLIPSLDLATDYEYTGDAINSLYPMGTKLSIKSCDLGWKSFGKEAVCHCKKGNCKWKKFNAKKFGCSPDLEFIKNQDDSVDVDSIASMFVAGEIATIQSMVNAVFGDSSERTVVDHAAFIAQQAAEKAADKAERFEMLGLDMYGIGKGGKKKEAIQEAWEKIRAERKEERKVKRQEILANAPKVCGDREFNPETMHPPKCSGNAAGDFCNLRCKKNHTWDERKSQTSYCTCSKRNICKWTEVPDCV